MHVINQLALPQVTSTYSPAVPHFTTTYFHTVILIVYSRTQSVSLSHIHIILYFTHTYSTWSIAHSSLVFLSMQEPYWFWLISCVWPFTAIYWFTSVSPLIDPLPVFLDFFGINFGLFCLAFNKNHSSQHVSRSEVVRTRANIYNSSPIRCINQPRGKVRYSYLLLQQSVITISCSKYNSWQ